MRENENALLHWPSRKNHLETLESHITKAARLSRALWLMAQNDAICTYDIRDWFALSELATAVADHASAAELLFRTEDAENAKNRT